VSIALFPILTACRNHPYFIDVGKGNKKERQMKVQWGKEEGNNHCDAIITRWQGRHKREPHIRGC
jgi:hypothetical protein